MAMTVEELCKKYQRNQWNRVITRMNLNITASDIFEYIQEPKYYGNKSSPIADMYLINTYNCLRCNTPLRFNFFVGHNTAKKQCKCASKGFALDREKLLVYFDDENTITTILEDLTQRKVKKFPNLISYWLNKGFNEIDAKAKVVKYNTELGKKLQKISRNKPLSEHRENSHRCVEHWIKKGYSEKEAQEQVTIVQTTNGLAWYQNKYGDLEGKSKYDDRISKWLTTFRSKEDIEEIDKSKGRTREQLIEKMGLDEYTKMQDARTHKIITTRIEKGEYIPRELIDKKKEYYAAVMKFTRFSCKQYDGIINPDSDEIGEKYHVDHMFSKAHGLINNIPPEIIGNPLNLKTITSFENQSKGSNSTLTIEELYESYYKAKSKHWYPY